MSHQEVQIRTATHKDAEAFILLVNALADYEKLARPDAAACERLVKDAFGEQKRIDVFLAEVGGQPVGYAIVLETYSSFLALPTLYLEDIFVLSQHRGRRAGYLLFKHCVREAVKRGCGRMEWMVLDWNKLAQDFYERLGARRLGEWLPYRMVRTELEAMLQDR